MKKAEKVLETHKLMKDGKMLHQEKKVEAIPDASVLPEQVGSSAIEELNAGKEKDRQIELSELHEIFEDPKSIKSNISLDDVCSKKQKASGRKKGSSPKEKREMVNNTVAHIQNGASQTYTLN